MDVGSIVVNGTVRQVSTEYMLIASGSNDQRPSSPSNGMVRYNTDLSSFELYTSGGWFQVNTTIVQQRAPLATDNQTPVGTLWFWSQKIYICASIVRGASSWIELSQSTTIHPGLALNRYYSSDGGILATIQLKTGTVFAMPILLSVGMDFNRVGIEVTKSKSRATARLGLYYNDAGYPGALAVDLGIVPADSTGTKEILSSFAVSSTQFFWLAVTVSDTITLRAVDAPTGNIVLGRASTNGAGVTHFAAPRPYGGMPATFPQSTPEVGNAPFVWIRKV